MIKLIIEPLFLFYCVKCLPAKQIIAPYGIGNHLLKALLLPENNFGRNTKIITKPEQKQKLIDYGFNAISWKCIHAKLLTGINGALLGSWNFHLEHEKKATQREIVLFISNDEPLYAELCQRFSEWFEYAAQWQEGE